MTFKATIKFGMSEVSTTECNDVTLVTPAEHTIRGATATCAYDRLHGLVGQYCMPGTKRGNGHADDMGRALGAVLENQLAVIASMNRDLAEARNGRDKFCRERDEARADAAACRRLLGANAERLGYAPAQDGKPTPAVTKDTPVTLGMLRELHQTSSDIADEQWERDCEKRYQQRCDVALAYGRPTPERPRASPL